MLTPRLKEKNDYNQIMQGGLISIEMEVDEQELLEPEAKEVSANVEAQPSIKLSEKLTTNMEKLEANVEKVTSDIAEIKANQLMIIDLLSHGSYKIYVYVFNDNFY